MSVSSKRYESSIASAPQRQSNGLGHTPVPAGWGGSGARFAFALIVVVVTWVGEEYSTEPGRWWYQREILGVPLHYPLLAGVLLLLAPTILRTPVFPFSRALRSAGLWRWSVAAVVAVGLSFGVGLLRQSVELFADWRNMAVLALVAAAAARWLAHQPWRRWVITDMAIAYGVMSSLSLGIWMLGGGSVLLGVRVPIWYFNNLFLAAFAAIVATDFWLEQKEGTVRSAYSRALGWSAISSTLVVALSFRRSLWLLLVVGMSLVAWRALRARRLSPRKWLTISLFGSLSVVILVLSIGPAALSERIASISPTSDNRLASTNSDHLGDMADAWDVIAQSPVAGLGVGAYYETNRIANWKVRSFEVHNAFLHAWLKFGLLGLVVYIGFHLRWIGALFKAGRVGGLAGGAGAGIYLLADQVPASIQTWAYGSFQLSVQRGILLAALLVSVAETARRAGPTPTTASVFEGLPVSTSSTGTRIDENNLAVPVFDGGLVVVPAPGGSTPAGQPGASTSDGLISLNRADAAQLQDLPGIGALLAARIVDYRESNGPFEIVEDLLDVPGIGEVKLAAMRDLLTVP
jgi:competence ComEA-like helix-hairpin-helix protein